jgi:hypothetical protein
MIQKDTLHRLLAGFYFLQVCAVLLALTCYSYRVRELLVCWLFLCSLFALIALPFLGAVLAWLAGQYLLKWVSAAKTLIPELAVRFAELPPDAISAPRILVAGTPASMTGPYASVDVLAPHSGRLINVVSSSKANV